jgi:hypothetical protein
VPTQNPTQPQVTEHATSATIPIIFEDLHLRYQAAIIELKIKVTPQTSLASPPDGAHFVLAQLSKRKSNGTDANPPNYSHTYPLWVSAAVILLKDHMDVLNKLADGGLDTFTFDLDSAPAGATVYYARAGLAFQSFSGVTPLKQKTLELALWTFKFEKEGCSPAIQQVDAVQEPNPHPYGDLTCQGDKRIRR